jgi:TetR/AcrR family transcriptional repressor of nem operon
MAVKKTDRDNVIDGALNLFRVKGYHHTSMSDISGACGLLKGSVYHYFPGKKELAVAALDRVIEDGRAKLFNPAHDPANDDGRTPKERLQALADAVERYFIGREGGCVMGNLALEVGGSVPEFVERIRTYFEDWAKALTKLLAGKYGEQRARELAEDAIARAQGAIMIMGLTGDEEILRRAGRDIVALLD